MIAVSLAPWGKLIPLFLAVYRDITFATTMSSRLTALAAQ
jgi:hypothetical protein